MSSGGSLRQAALVIVLTVLAFLTTLVIRIPIPATTGYFNIGDVFVILAGLWLGPAAGLIVGGVGPMVADAVGYPQFVVATICVKALEGVVAGGLGRVRANAGWKLVSAYLAAAVMVAGYFSFEAYIYPAIGRMIPFFRVT